MKRRAFTLIELLVVIAVIALLVSILMPALGKAKALALSASCQSNMRNIGMAHAMYLNDSDGVSTVRNDWWGPDGLLSEPVTTAWWMAGSNNARRWFDVLSQYLVPHDLPMTMAARRDTPGATEKFRALMGSYFCPSDKTVAWNQWMRVASYGVPETVFKAYREKIVGEGAVDPGGGDSYAGASRSHFFEKASNPSGIVYLSEFASEDGWCYQGSYVGMGEHASPLSVENRNPAGLYSADAGWDHNLNLNYLFLDGHVGANLSRPPHGLDRRNLLAQWRSVGGTVTWLTEGYGGFKIRFNAP